MLAGSRICCDVAAGNYHRRVNDCAVKLYWLPVGAGTHFQKAWLVAYSWCLAQIARTPRSEFVHAALKVERSDRCFTLELMPVPAQQQTQPLMSGAVGSPLAARLRIFQYQLLCLQSMRLPDEAWAVESPITLLTWCAIADRVLQNGHDVPHSSGAAVRREPRRCGPRILRSHGLSVVQVSMRALRPSAGTQAPGWRAGVQLARQSERG